LKLKKNMYEKKLSVVTWTLFLTTLVVVLISLTSAVFPIFIAGTFGNFDTQIGIDIFETGIWAFPLLAINSIILVLGILYKKKSLPNIIKNSIDFIFRFEVSSKVAFFVLITLIGFYILFSVNELFDGFYFEDYDVRVKTWIDNFSVTEVGDEGNGRYLMVFFLKSSDLIFDNDKVIPFLASIALLIVTYVFTTEITKKRFAGIVAMVIVLQSGIFLMYDTSVSYPNFWILFYVLSLYLIIKKTPLSPIAYLISILTKYFTIIFLPMTLFFIYRTNFTRKKKIRIILYYGIVLISIWGFVEFADVVQEESKVSEKLQASVSREFEAHKFWSGFTDFYNSFRFDGLVLLCVLPCIVGLFFASRGGIQHADSIMFLILAMLISAPIIAGPTGILNTPYRFLPLVVFFAIGVGVLLSKRVKAVS